jgi:hypothetical protein
MLPIQRESSLRMIESLRIPSHDLEVLAIVLGVAANTVLAGSGRSQHGSVIATPGSYTRSDIFMTFEAAELRGAGAYRVAGNATGWAVPLAVSFGERARTDLRRRRNGKQYEDQYLQCGTQTQPRREAQPLVIDNFYYSESLRSILQVCLSPKSAAILLCNRNAETTSVQSKVHDGLTLWDYVY